MPLLPRSGSARGPDAAARVLTLLGSTPSVDAPWVPGTAAQQAPPPAPEPGDAPASPPARPLASTPASPSALPSARPLGEPRLETSGEPWSPGQEHLEPAPTVAALLRSGRIDPGRQGVLALALVGLVAAAVAGYLLLHGRASEQPVVPPAVAGSVATSTGPELVIDVAGKVKHPGLVRLPAGARVDDALRAAGGVLPGTPTAALNLARKVADGEQVVVGDQPTVPGDAAGAPTGLLDLNTATAQQLDALPGIGPVLADKIVSWRTEHGRFASTDQLREVGGIGESKYASIKSKVRV